MNDSIFERPGNGLPLNWRFPGGPAISTEPRPAPQPNTEAPKKTVILSVDIPRSVLKSIAVEFGCIRESERRELAEIQNASDKLSSEMGKDPAVEHASAFAAWSSAVAAGETAGQAPRIEDFLETARQRRLVLREEQQKLHARSGEIACAIFERIRPHFAEFISNHLAREQELAKALNFEIPDPADFPSVGLALKSSLHRFDDLVKTGLRGAPRDVLRHIVEFPS